LLRRAAFTTCTYQTLAAELAADFGVAPERIAIVPYGVAPTLPPNVTRPAERDGPIVGYVERLDLDRAWEVTVDAVAVVRGTFPGARLWLGAGAPLRNRARAYARERGYPFDIVGFDLAELGAFFGGIDLLAVPRGRDGLPFGLVQALVDGVPVVAANDAGLADTLLTYRSRWLVDNDARGFARAIGEAWGEADQAWNEAQAERPRAIAAFDPAQVCAAIATIYDRIAAAAAPLPAAENE
jgi:glycosyltransferase involved in cell wall biosynthesis